MPIVQVKPKKSQGAAASKPAESKHTLVSVHMHVDQKEAFKAKAEELGQSLSGFFIYSAEKTMNDQERKGNMRALEAENKVLREEVQALQQRIQALLEQTVELRQTSQEAVATEEIASLSESIEAQLQRQRELEWEMSVFKSTLKKMAEHLRGRDETINALVTVINRKAAITNTEERKRHYQNSLRQGDEEFFFPANDELSKQNLLAKANYLAEIASRFDPLSVNVSPGKRLLDNLVEGVFEGDAELDSATAQRIAAMQQRAGL